MTMLAKYVLSRLRTKLSITNLRYFSNKTTSVLLWDKLEEYGKKTAIVDGKGPHTYEAIYRKSVSIASEIAKVQSNASGSKPNCAPHVTFLCPNDATYFTVLLACWLNGSSAVPLCPQHPVSQWEYFIRDSNSSLVVSTEANSEVLSKVSVDLGVPFYELRTESGEPEQDVTNWAGLKKVSKNTNALLLYTSGTTGSPKGVVITHGILEAQMEALVQAWKITKNDVLLHVLPLHHMHGVVNALLCQLYSGATVYMLPKFEVARVWDCLTSSEVGVNTFMAVPTIYEKLLEYYDTHFEGKTSVKEFIRATCNDKIRLMVSGSAALRETTFNRWAEVTGHRLLERYGMTEIGMALTNPLKGLRKPGFVGTPFLKVEVCIAKANKYARLGYDVINTGNGTSSATLTPKMEADSGELYVRGPNVFQEYWNRPQETKTAFTSDGWFKTGDTAQYDNGSYKILGRTSVDIIKSGGYKISALDVERHLLYNEHVAKCAVVGLPDIVWGQKVACVVVKKKTSELTAEQLREWCKTKLPPYCVPTVIKFMDQIPCNVMGKVNKKTLIKDVFN